MADLFGGLMGALKKVVLTTKEVSPENPLQDMVFERGVYEFFDEKGKQADLGKWVTIKMRDMQCCCIAVAAMYCCATVQLFVVETKALSTVETAHLLCASYTGHL